VKSFTPFNPYTNRMVLYKVISRNPFGMTTLKMCHIVLSR